MKKKIYMMIMIMTLVVGQVIFVTDHPTYASGKKYAKIAEFEGNATVEKSGSEKEFKVFKGMAVSEGDRITTGVGSSVTLEVDETKTVKIGDNTKIDISELKSSADGTKSSVKLWGGKVYVDISKKLGADEKFDIKTPTAVMGVRGTKFYVTVEKVKDKDTREDKEKVNIGVIEGTVAAKYFVLKETTTQETETKEIETFLTQDQSVEFVQTLDEITDVEVKEIDAKDVPLTILEEIMNLPPEELEFIFTPEERQEIQQIIEEKQQEIQQEIEEFNQALEELENLIENPLGPLDPNLIPDMVFFEEPPVIPPGYTPPTGGGGRDEETYTPPNQNITSDTTPPIASIISTSQTMGMSVTTARSNELGYLYLIKSTYGIANKASLDAAVSNQHGAVTTVTTANTDMIISTTGLIPGIYYLYAVDESENISDRSADLVRLTSSVAQIDYGSTITTGAVDPTLTINLTGDTFSAGASNLGNWTFTVGATGLVPTSVNVVSGTQAVISFSGTAQAYQLSVVATGSALTGGTASNLTSYVVGTNV